MFPQLLVPLYTKIIKLQTNDFLLIVTESQGSKKKKKKNVTKTTVDDSATEHGSGRYADNWTN